MLPSQIFSGYSLHAFPVPLSAARIEALVLAFEHEQRIRALIKAFAEEKDLERLKALATELEQLLKIESKPSPIRDSE